MPHAPESTRTVEELTEAMARGARPAFLFFWGHTPKTPGAVDASCFSNWFPAAFTVDGVRYATTEHYMMAEKARLFGDGPMRKEIFRAASPAEAKQFGRKVARFDEETWKQHRFQIVVAGNLAKFSQHPAMRDFLLATKDKVIVEAAPRDRIWGIGMGRDNENAPKPNQWRGLNLLGFALMEVRARLAAA
jgi:ribA/ribD-fused uncharacterized protein